MNCQKCGAVIPEGSVNCPQCGELVNSVAPVATQTVTSGATNVVTPEVTSVAAPAAPVTDVVNATPAENVAIPVSSTTLSDAAPVAPVTPVVPDVATPAVAPVETFDSTPASKKNNITLIAVIVVLIVAILVVCYFLFLKDGSDSTTTTTKTTTTATTAIADTKNYYTYGNYKFAESDIYSFADSTYFDNAFDVKSSNFGITYYGGQIFVDTIDSLISQDDTLVQSYVNAGYSAYSDYGEVNGKYYYFIVTDKLIFGAAEFDTTHSYAFYIYNTGTATSLNDISSDLEGIADLFSIGSSNLSGNEKKFESTIPASNSELTYSGTNLSFNSTN